MLIDYSKKIAIIVSSPMTARFFLLHQIQALSKLYDLTVVADFEGQTALVEWLPKSVTIIDVPIKRKIHLWYDIKALILLLFLFYKSQFVLVHSVTPKAGLLSMLASWLVRVPIRLHTFTGQVWVTKNGVRRLVLRCLDQLINLLSTLVLIDSHSQFDFLLKNKVITRSSSLVLGDGSISGVDCNRFRVDPAVRATIRNELDVAESTVVILFLGRLNRDKGVLKLSEAFCRVHSRIHNSALWLVGPDEEHLLSGLKHNDGLNIIPFTNVPEHYMNAADIFCLPSFREGFGNVVIEAAACGIPSIGSNIYGLSDAIVDGETGLLVKAGSVVELETAIQQLITDKKMRRKMGEAARVRTVEKFSQSDLTEKIITLYENIL